MARAVRGARLRRGRRHSSLLHSSIREFEEAGRRIVGSAPVGHDGTAAWLDAIGDACNVPADKVDAAKNAVLPIIRQALAGAPIKGTITLSGYEGSELLVARLLIESGAACRYVGTACPKTAWSEPTATGSRRRASRCSSAPRWSRTRPPSMRVQAGPRHRHHAGGAEGEGAAHPGALLHQPDLGPPADGSRRCRLAGAGVNAALAAGSASSA
jgi:hypothetical protein